MFAPLRLFIMVVFGLRLLWSFAPGMLTFVLLTYLDQFFVFPFSLSLVYDHRGLISL